MREAKGSGCKLLKTGRLSNSRIEIIGKREKSFPKQANEMVHIHTSTMTNFGATFRLCACKVLFSFA